MRFMLRISNSTLTSADLRASHEYFMETHVEYLATVTGAPLQSLSISAPPNQIGGTVSSIPTNSSVPNSATPQISQPKSSSTNQSTTQAQAASLSSSTAQSMNNNTSSTPTTSSASSKGNGDMIDILERVVNTPATGSSGATNSHNQTEAMKENRPPQQQQSQAPTAAMKGNKITSNSMKKEDKDKKPYHVRLPGFLVENETGLGDIIKRATSAFGSAWAGRNPTPSPPDNARC